MGVQSNSPKSAGPEIRVREVAMIIRPSVFTSGIFVSIVLICALPVSAQDEQSGPQIMYEVNHDTSPPLRLIARPPERRIQSPRPLYHPNRTSASQALGLIPEIQRPSEIPLLVSQVPATIGLNFDGVSNLNGFIPPDPNASVGRTQVVETVNLSYEVFDKKTGSSELGPAAIGSIWNGFQGNLCGKSTTEYADPIVLYDKAAKRWLITITANTPNFSSNSECLAISTTSDATSSYHRYEISYGSDYVDYPKFGVWPDGYYMSILVFSTPPPDPLFIGPDVCALDRTAMLAGKALSVECFQRASGDFVLLPSDLDSAKLPLLGEPNFFLEIFRTVNESSTMLLFKFHADFVNKQNASFTGPIRISVNPFHEACADGFTCIPQGGTSQQLDALGDRLMHRLAYRNFSDHEVLLATHAVVGTLSAATMQWYEIRSPNLPPLSSSRAYSLRVAMSLPGWEASQWIRQETLRSVSPVQAVHFSPQLNSLDASQVIPKARCIGHKELKRERVQKRNLRAGGATTQA
jgi:hypothetical protein